MKVARSWRIWQAGTCASFLLHFSPDHYFQSLLTSVCSVWIFCRCPVKSEARSVKRGLLCAGDSCMHSNHPIGKMCAVTVRGHSRPSFLNYAPMSDAVNYQTFRGRPAQRSWQNGVEDKIHNNATISKWCSTSSRFLDIWVLAKMCRYNQYIYFTCLSIYTLYA